jgi:hypothetical protein
VLKRLNQNLEESVKNNVIIMYMSFGINPLLKKDFIKYVIDNNIFIRNNIKLNEKIDKIIGSTRNYKKVEKKNQTDANNMLKKVSLNQLSSKVRTLKAENRRLRHFNRKFKETLESGVIWENAINDVESMSKSMVKGKNKKSLGKRKRKGKNRGKKKTKKGGRRRKTRRESKKGGFFSFNFFKNGCDKYQTSERIADIKNCKKDKNCYYELRGSAGTFCYNKPNKSKGNKKKKGTRKRK